MLWICNNAALKEGNKFLVFGLNLLSAKVIESLNHILIHKFIGEANH